MNINHSKSMTTLTITLPDDKIDVITAISTIIKNAGGSINIDDDSLTPAEFTLLQEAYKEALMIKDGLKTGMPATELWND